MSRLVAGYRAAAAALMVSGAVLACQAAAGADFQAGQVTDGSGVTVSAGGSSATGGAVRTGSGSSGSGSGGTTCANTYAPVTNGAFLTELEKGTPHNGAPGGWYLSTSCDGQYQGPVWLGAGGNGPGAPAVDPAVLAQEAKRRLPVPTPTITMTPPPGKVLVNDNTFLSIDPSQWGQRTASASAAGVTSTVVGVPEKVVWSMGDGQQVVCTGPGTPYSPAIDFDAQQPDCGYVYKRSSAGYPNDAVTVTATL